MLNTAWLMEWKERRGRRRVQAEARHLVREARRVLEKRSDKIPEAVARDVEASAAEVERALETSASGEDTERLRQAVGRLDEKMDEHLAFARKSSVREYVESIGVAVAIALLLRAFVVEAFQIPSGSMIPTLEVGDHIFVSKFSYGIGIPFTYKKLVQFGTPRRGDVIVFRYPADPEVDYIKRVVALPGEKIEVRKNEIFIDGKLMPREHIQGPCSYEEGPAGQGERKCELWLEQLEQSGHVRQHQVYQDPNQTPTQYGPTVVPPNHVFVMGDNRDNSNDSRVWGTVPQHFIKGRALIVWWSRGPTSGNISVSGASEWFGAIRWSRFFSLVR
jgi:signal peptidase I